MSEPQEEQPTNAIVRVVNARPLGDPIRLWEQEEYMRFVRNYRGSDAIDFSKVTASEERSYCTTLVRGAFQLIHLDAADFPDCFEASIGKAIQSHAVKATKWSKWGGYRDFCEKLKQCVHLTNTTGVRHILCGPLVISAIIVKTLRKVDTTGRDVNSSLINHYDMFAYANAAVQLYQDTKSVVIKTSVRFEGTGMSVSGDSIEVPITNPVADEHTSSATTITQGDGDLDVSDTMSLADIDYFPKRNMAQLMFECQQFDLQGARPRTPEPNMEIEIAVRQARSITREQALDKVGELIDDAKSHFNDETSNKLASALTKEIVKVLPREKKNMVNAWATMRDMKEVTEWVDESADDCTSWEWTEIAKVPGQPRWSSNGPFETIVSDLEDLADTDVINIPEVGRRKMRALSYQLRHVYRHLESMAEMRAEAKRMNSLKELRKEIVKELRQDIESGISGVQTSISNSQTNIEHAIESQSKKTRAMITNKRVRLNDDVGSRATADQTTTNQTIANETIADQTTATQ